MIEELRISTLFPPAFGGRCLKEGKCNDSARRIFHRLPGIAPLIRRTISGAPDALPKLQGSLAKFFQAGSVDLYGTPLEYGLLECEDVIFFEGGI